MERIEGYNRHHSISPKYRYKHPIAKRFREHPFLINRVEIDPHADYHATHAHPLVLSNAQILGCLSMMEQIDETLPPHERIAELADYLSSRSDREQRVADNLFVQVGFIEEFGFKVL